MEGHCVVQCVRGCKLAKVGLAVAVKGGKGTGKAVERVDGPSF